MLLRILLPEPKLQGQAILTCVPSAVRVVAVYSIEKNPLALLLHETRNPCVAQSPDLIKKTKVEETC